MKNECVSNGTVEADIHAGLREGADARATEPELLLGRRGDRLQALRYR